MTRLELKRSSTGAIVVLSAIFLAAGLPARGEGQPAKKDSNARIRPKQANLSVEISPKTAKPGDVVKFTVVAEVTPPYHIYKYSKTQAEEGPSFTSFDFFETGGLIVKGDWTPDRAPIKKKEPVFPDIPFLEFYEDRVAWTIELEVPKDAPAGKKILKCQVGYQVCSDQNCSIPGRWTLEPAELTVESGAVVAAAPKAADGPTPKRKDSTLRIKPKTVELSASISPSELKAGQVATLSITARLQPGNHIYKFAVAEAEEGPANTRFDLFDSGGLRVREGAEWKPSKPPIRKPETLFPGIAFVEYHEDEVTWSIELVVPDDAKPGSRSARVQAEYQVCDARVCSIAGRWTLENVAFSIVPGKAEPPLASNIPASATPPAAQVAVNAAAAVPISAPAELDAAKPAAESEVKRTAGQGFLAFLIFCAGGGLLSLAMPCVWPMVPITVNFFVKQGQKNKGKTTALAAAYGLSIVGVFTLVGLLCSVFFGSASLSKIANNAWLNFFVAGLFVVFGLSLLGLFEIRLPSFLLNASAKGESRGGLLGVVFMALTLTITSFTCTFPVVGGLIVMAAQGDYFYPVVGLATFASVIALPFFVLAMAPGLLSQLPKSGDWMNAVKVVGGLVEIGAAFKFFNTAECSLGVNPRDAWFNAPTVLSLWVVLSFVCGIYLLGLFRTDHDHGEGRVGPGRLMFSGVFLFLGLYLTPALFGNPPHGPIWERLIVGLLPPDAAELRSGGVLAARGAAEAPGPGGEARESKATSSDPDKAQREQTSFHGVVWGMSYEAALERAKAEGRPILIDFTGVNCPNCRQMEVGVFPRREIVELLKQFVTVQLYTDRVIIDTLTLGQKESLAEKNQDKLLELAGEVTNPYYAILSPDGTFVSGKGGYIEAPLFREFLASALERARKSTSVASLGGDR